MKLYLKHITFLILTFSTFPIFAQEHSLVEIFPVIIKGLPIGILLELYVFFSKIIFWLLGITILSWIIYFKFPNFKIKESKKNLSISNYLRFIFNPWAMSGLLIFSSFFLMFMKIGMPQDSSNALIVEQKKQDWLNKSREINNNRPKPKVKIPFTNPYGNNYKWPIKSQELFNDTTIGESVITLSNNYWSTTGSVYIKVCKMENDNCHLVKSIYYLGETPFDIINLSYGDYRILYVYTKDKEVMGYRDITLSEDKPNKSLRIPLEPVWNDDFFSNDFARISPTNF